MEKHEYIVWFGGLLAALMLFSAWPACGQAAVQGKVNLPKPEMSTVPPPHYAGQMGEIAPPDPPTAVVYLEGQFPVSATNQPAVTNLVLQQGMQFRPALLPVRVGTPVIFPNEDDFYHNVFSYSKPKRFDLGRYRKTDKPGLQVFDKPGVVKLYCDIHHHMRGIILVLETPYFIRTQTNGTYRLEDLPAGKYLLKAWVDEKRTWEKPVQLEAGQTLHVDFDAK
jgi:plastocyanin